MEVYIFGHDFYFCYLVTTQILAPRNLSVDQEREYIQGSSQLSCLCLKPSHGSPPHKSKSPKSYLLTSTFPTGPMISLTSYFTYSSPTHFLALLVISWKFLAFSQWDFTLAVHSAQTALSTEHLFAHLIPSLPLFLFSGQETFKIATHLHILALLSPSWFTVLHSIYNLLVMPYNSLYDFVLLFLVCFIFFVFCWVGGGGSFWVLYS